MKKTILSMLLVAGTALTAYSQEISENALGLRLGASDGFGTEISYQRALRSDTRLEFDLGWRDNDNFDAFKLTGLHQWVFPLDGNFNWYAGAGGGVGSVDFDDERFDNDNDGAFIFAAGNIGIEYNFDIPLLLSLDFRPEFGISGYDGFDNDFDFDIALGIRYQF